MKSQKGLIGWIILAILGVALLILGLLYLKSFDSLPGDSSYKFKEISENLQLTIYDLSFDGKAGQYLEMADVRITELQELVKKGNKDKEIIETLQRLNDHQTKALNNIDRARNKSINVAGLLIKMEVVLQKEQIVFPELSFQVVEETAQAFQKATSQADDLLTIVENRKVGR